MSLGLFWHGHKRFPESAPFDASNPDHVDYIYHGANILASVFRLKEQTREQVQAMLPALVAQDKPWEPSNVKITLDEEKSGPAPVSANPAADEKKAEAAAEEDHAAVARLTAELRALDLSKFKPLVSADFEKVGQQNSGSANRRVEATEQSRSVCPCLTFAPL